MLKGSGLTYEQRKERFHKYIEPLLLQNLTIAEIMNVIDLKYTRIRVECKEFCSKELLAVLRHNTTTRINKTTSDNIQRKEKSKQRYFSIIQPLIWEGLTTIDITKRLNYKAPSVVRFDTRRFGTLEDNEQLKLNGVIKKRNVIIKLMTNKTSRPEKDLFKIAQTYFPAARHKYHILSDKNYFWELDVAVPELKLNFEYDGYHWHKNQEMREIKRDKFLKQNGWQVFRFKYGESPPYEVLEQAFKDQVLSQL
jgi:hypothetical protein